MSNDFLNFFYRIPGSSGLLVWPPGLFRFLGFATTSKLLVVANPKSPGSCWGPGGAAGNLVIMFKGLFLYILRIYKHFYLLNLSKLICNCFAGDYFRGVIATD